MRGKCGGVRIFCVSLRCCRKESFYDQRREIPFCVPCSAVVVPVVSGGDYTAVHAQDHIHTRGIRHNSVCADV